MKKSIYIILAIALIASLNISAQVDSIGMPAEKVEVIKRYEASILQEMVISMEHMVRIRL